MSFLAILHSATTAIFVQTRKPTYVRESGGLNEFPNIALSERRKF